MKIRVSIKLHRTNSMDILMHLRLFGSRVIFFTAVCFIWNQRVCAKRRRQHFTWDTQGMFFLVSENFQVDLSFSILSWHTNCLHVTTTHKVPYYLKKFGFISLWLKIVTKQTENCLIFIETEVNIYLIFLIFCIMLKSTKTCSTILRHICWVNCHMNND